jgi:RNA polymerase sigma-70 factor (family 1)
MGSELANVGLITYFNAREKSAFAEIYELYHRAIHSYAFKVIGQMEDAEDIAAEAFIKLWKSPEQFESLGNVRAFLFRITRNACLDYLKSSHRKVVLQDNFVTDAISDSEEPFHQITADLIQLISRLLENLPKKRRAIMQMILLQGLNDTQVAEHLDINPKTVRNQKNTAIQYLRQEISL